MKTVETFTINCNQKIEIQVPELEEKFNYYYKPTEDVHRFDKIIIVYSNTINKILLANDALQYLLYDEFYTTIKMLLSNKLEAPSHLKGYVGLQGIRDELANRIEETESTEPVIGIEYLLWDNTKDIQSLMYRIDNKYYLEVSPQYEWLFGPLVEDDEDIDDEPEGFYSFEEYEKNYKPLVVAELSKETLLDWKKKCEDIFDQVGISYT